LTVARIGNGVARSFQTPFTVASLSTLDNVAVGRRQVTEGPLGVLKYAPMRDGNETSIRNEARMLLERLGLGGQAEVFGLELSAGQRRRADLARAVFSQSQLLLLDEPFANLDPEVALGVAKLLQDMANEGRSVLVIEHRSGLALSIADVLLEISGRRLVPARHASTHASEGPH
jgi:branched-chain amino acid transport system ATP-binding protein